MQTHSRQILLALLVGATLMLAGCGQKGDLYLPEGNSSTVVVG